MRSSALLLTMALRFASLSRRDGEVRRRRRLIVSSSDQFKAITHLNRGCLSPTCFICRARTLHLHRVFSSTSQRQPALNWYRLFLMKSRAGITHASSSFEDNFSHVMRDNAGQERSLCSSSTAGGSPREKSNRCLSWLGR